MPDKCKTLNRNLEHALRKEGMNYTQLQVSRHLCFAHNNEVGCENMDEHEGMFKRSQREVEELFDDMMSEGCW